MPEKTKKQEEVQEFTLLAGQHIQADHEWEPPETAVKLSRNGYYVDKDNKVVLDPDTEKPIRCPSRVYEQGDTVPSTTDLVEKLGHQKFAYKDVGKRKKKTPSSSSTPSDPSSPPPAVPESKKHTHTRSDLNKLSTADLKKLCEEEEVDLPKTASREQMLKALES